MKIERVLQDNEMLKQALKQAKHEYDILEKYYEGARMDNKDLEEELEEIYQENAELFRENRVLKNKLVESGKKIAELQGKLDKLTNILNILTGREDW